MGSQLFDLYPRKCATCGKPFEATQEYVYREGEKHKKVYWFCSWKCLRQFRATHRQRKRRA